MKTRPEEMRALTNQRRWRIYLLGFLFGFSISWFFVTGRTKIHHHVPPSRYADYIPENSVTKQRQPGSRVLCWLPMLTVDHKKKSELLSTWGRRCDKFYIVSKEGNVEDDVIAH